MKNFSGQESSHSSAGMQPQGPTEQNIVEVDEILKDLIPDFMTRRFQEFEQMEKMADSEDFPGLAQYGHKLKGSSLNYGFQYLGGLAAQLESAAQSKNTGLIRQLISDIETHVRNVQIVYVE